MNESPMRSILRGQPNAMLGGGERQSIESRRGRSMGDGEESDGVEGEMRWTRRILTWGEAWAGGNVCRFRRWTFVSEEEEGWVVVMSRTSVGLDRGRGYGESQPSKADSHRGGGGGSSGGVE